MSLLSDCRQTARRTFRIQILRLEQESAMLAVLNGRDALVALPTGFGKSLIYQVPAMIFDRPTIVISPLIALMADQERALKRCGVPVVALHSRLRAAERRTALGAAQKGSRSGRSHDARDLESAATRLVQHAQPALLCIDEAHCISEWGHDFRPAYLRLGDARKRLGNPPALALTATATPRVREDIAERLRLDSPRVIVAPAHRENLRLTVDIVPGSEKFPVAARRIKRLQRRASFIAPRPPRSMRSRAHWAARIRLPVITGRCVLPIGRSAASVHEPSRRLIMVATTAFGIDPSQTSATSCINRPPVRWSSTLEIDARTRRAPATASSCLTPPT
jgi:ATP-dependent DNA helicase RecQ